MKLHLRLLFILLAISFNSFGQFNATIKVTDSNTGANLENAEVTFDGNFFANTDANGEATFTDVANGTYNYTVSLSCFNLFSSSLTIDNADNIENVALDASTTNSIFFYVGSPFTISGATVAVTNGGDFYQEITTGNWLGDVMENVPFGDYTYTITTPCYETVTGDVTVDCTDGNGILVEANPEPSTSNSIFFYVGSPLTINGATVTVTDGGDFYQELTTGNWLGDVMENVPFGDYTYTITTPCYETVTGDVTVDCTDGNGILVEANPEPTTTNSIFFYVGSPLTINGATVTVTDGGDFYQELTTGNWLGDVMENVPFGDYTYTITTPCYETVTGEVTVDCTDGNGIIVEANPTPSTTNSIFFYVGSPLTISGATVIVTDGADFTQELTTGAPIGDVMENVPFGDYTYTITAPCYETVTGDVTVNCTDGNGIIVEANPAEIVIDNTVTEASNTLTANASGYNYQWVNCDTDEEIEGATGQTFIATENGNYKVVIISENCSATSECVAVTTVGISENSNNLKVTTYPNPFTDIVKFESDAFKSKEVSVKIFTITGQLVMSQDFTGQRLIALNLSEIQNGAYLVQIISAEGQYFSQIIKQ